MDEKIGMVLSIEDKRNENDRASTHLKRRDHFIESIVGGNAGIHLGRDSQTKDT